MAIHGRVCTQPPEEIIFPVKILFVADQSTSLQLCTDPQKRRFEAMQSVVDSLQAEPNVLFGFVGFSSWVRTQAFTKDLSKMKPFLDASGGVGPATDYQGALASAIKVLEQDLVDSGPIRARTRYVVIFVSDGIPEPRCNAGCEDDKVRCADGVDNDGDGLIDGADDSCANLSDASLTPDILYAQCNTDKTMGENEYVDYGGSCPEYNQPHQITQRLSELLALETIYSAGSITFHTVFLFTDDPQILTDEDCAKLFGYSQDPARELLQSMAAMGGGTFEDVNLNADVSSVFQFDFSTLESTQWLTEFVAVNEGARRLEGALVPDSDMDGVPDDVEREAGTAFDLADSDGDGYPDLIETRFEADGFDPLDELEPAVACTDGLDLDGDGLPDCAEAFLGTDPRGPDTDADGVLDSIEVAIRTDPLVHDALLDPDFDGVLTADEVRGGTDPRFADPENWHNGRTRYSLVDKGTLEDGRHCYDFEVTGVELAVTSNLEAIGRNRILLYSLERPVALINAAPTAQVGCVEVRYEGESGKHPESGVVDVSDPTWHALIDALGPALLAVRDCVGGDDFNRASIEAIVEQCLPPKRALQGYLRATDDMLALIRRYLDPDVQPRFPQSADELFVPLELYDPDLHCYRPGEVEELIELVGAIETACAQCQGFGL